MLMTSNRVPLAWLEHFQLSTAIMVWPMRCAAIVNSFPIRLSLVKSIFIFIF
jgi:hypothetical protein